MSHPRQNSFAVVAVIVMLWPWSIARAVPPGKEILIPEPPPQTAKNYRARARKTNQGQPRSPQLHRFSPEDRSQQGIASHANFYFF